MSELDKPPDVFERTNIPEQFTDLQDWKKFVPRVLKLTAQAYRLMCQRSISRWREDTFRINLVDSIKYVIYKQRIYDMKVENPKKLYTVEMMLGKELPKKAIEDLDVYQSKHQRDFNGRGIQLYHLFLVFDFDVQATEFGADNYIFST